MLGAGWPPVGPVLGVRSRELGIGRGDQPHQLPQLSQRSLGLRVLFTTRVSELVTAAR